MTATAIIVIWLICVAAICAFNAGAAKGRKRQEEAEHEEWNRRFGASGNWRP